MSEKETTQKHSSKVRTKEVLVEGNQPLELTFPYNSLNYQNQVAAKPVQTEFSEIVNYVNQQLRYLPMNYSQTDGAEEGQQKEILFNEMYDEVPYEVIFFKLIKNAD